MTTPIDEGTVDTLVRDQVSWITFSHPQHNSLPANQLERLTKSILHEGSNPASQVIVLQSAGERTFCAGANFQELASVRTLEEGTEFFMGFARLILSIRDCGKLVIGRIQGKAVGGGVGLVAATDYCMATKWASIRLSELSLGIGPYVIEPAIRRRAGSASFMKLALNPAEWQTAAWARDQGLYQEYFDQTGQMDDYLRRYLIRITEYSPQALKEIKKLLWEGTEAWPDLLSARARKSASLLLQEGTQLFLKKYLDQEKY
jgi:methylglutaconyl-CoA hydratase